MHRLILTTTATLAVAFLFDRINGFDSQFGTLFVSFLFLFDFVEEGKFGRPQELKMDFDSCENVATNQSCRVCGDDGVFDLWEMKFRYDDEDVMLIEAFNSFSTIDNVNQSRKFSCKKTCV